MLDVNIIQKFLIFSAGRSVDVARRCTPNEVKTICMTGSLVLVPSIIAFISMCCGVYLVSNNPVYALVGGIVWCGIIYTVDRAVVGYGRSKKIDRVFFGRLAFTIISSLCISIFAELFIFFDTITEQQTKELIELVDDAQLKYTRQISWIKQEVADAKADVERLQTIYLTELDGSLGTGRRGLGPVARAKQLAYETALADYQSLEASTNLEIAALLKKQEQEISLLKSSNGTGILSSLQALFAIEDPIIKYAAYLIRALLLFLELLPLLIKISPTGDMELYYKIVDEQDANKLKIQQQTNAERLRMLQEEQEQNLILAEMQALQQRTQRIIELNTYNQQYLATELQRMAKSQARAERNIEKSTDDYVLREELKEQLRTAFDHSMQTISSLVQKSADLNARLQTS